MPRHQEHCRFFRCLRKGVHEHCLFAVAGAGQKNDRPGNELAQFKRRLALQKICLDVELNGAAHVHVAGTELLEPSGIFFALGEHDVKTCKGRTHDGRKTPSLPGAFF